MLDGVYRRAMMRIGNIVELQLLSEATRLNRSSADPRKLALLMETVRAACVAALNAPPDDTAEVGCGSFFGSLLC